MPIRLTLYAEAVRSAWRRMLHLWKPMAAWTMVYGLIAGSLWGAFWLMGTLFLAGRTALAIPAYLSIRRPITTIFATASSSGTGTSRFSRIARANWSPWMV